MSALVEDHCSRRYEHHVDELLRLVASALVSMLAGGFAGAVYTNWQTGRRSKATATRVIAALEADLFRLREICTHNARTGDHSEQDRPRAFIHFPTQTYELLLFSGQTATLSDRSTLEAVMAYLQQAEHLNSMIRLFEQIEAQTSGLANAPLWPKKALYVQVIKEYCDSQMPLCLTRLDQAVHAARGARLATTR